LKVITTSLLFHSTKLAVLSLSLLQWSHCSQLTVCSLYSTLCSVLTSGTFLKQIYL